MQTGEDTNCILINNRAAQLSIQDTNIRKAITSVIEDIMKNCFDEKIHGQQTIDVFRRRLNTLTSNAYKTCIKIVRVTKTASDRNVKEVRRSTGDSKAIKAELKQSFERSQEKVKCFKKELEKNIAQELAKQIPDRTIANKGPRQIHFVGGEEEKKLSEDKFFNSVKDQYKHQTSLNLECFSWSSKNLAESTENLRLYAAKVQQQEENMIGSSRRFVGLSKAEQTFFDDY